MKLIELGLASKETKALDPTLQVNFDGNPPLPPGKITLGRFWNPM